MGKPPSVEGDSERLLRSLIDSITDYAIYRLDLDGTIASWNSGAADAKGYAADEVVGKNYDMFFTEEDRAAGRPQRGLAIAREQGRFEDEGWRVRKDGSRFWASIVVDAIRDERGQCVGFAKITRDISDKRALAEAREQLFQAQKLETVGHLTGGVAHDFNNLLAAVVGSLELIGKLNTDARIRNLIDIAQRAAERGAKLTQQLLAFARRQTLRPQPSNVNDLIAAFELLLRRAVGDAIALVLDLSPDIWASELDQSQFHAALLNLVVNARDAMPNGGRLTIGTDNILLDEDAARRLTGIGPGAFVRVTVRDSGHGMTPDVRERAVEPFFTTKDVGQGSGLGLSQVYGFVRQSNGQMRIESGPGQGTAIFLYLPRTLRAAEQDAEGAPPGARGLGTVLVVEDDIDVLGIATEAVRSFGYTVHAARDARDALSILQRTPAIDVLFTDVVMPGGINGVQLAQDARRLQPNIRVLLASGYPREALTRREGVRDNVAFIAKPYTLAALSAQLAAILHAGAPRPMAT